MEYECVLRNMPNTLEMTFYADGAAHDLDAPPVVTITRENGTVLVTDAPTIKSETGTYTYDLDAQANLDVLHIVWEGTHESQPAVAESYCEVVGGFLFTIAGLRGFDSVLADTAKYPDWKILEARGEVEEEFESACGRAFVPRYARETLSGDGTYELWLAHAEPLRVVALTVDEADELATAELVRDRDAVKLLLRRDAPWPEGTDNIVIAYEHGCAYPPSGVVKAAKKRARGLLTGSSAGINERALTMSTDAGTFRLADPSDDAAITGVPDIDKVLRRYDLRGGGIR